MPVLWRYVWLFMVVTTEFYLIPSLIVSKWLVSKVNVCREFVLNKTFVGHSFANDLHSCLRPLWPKSRQSTYHSMYDQSKYDRRHRFDQSRHQLNAKCELGNGNWYMAPVHAWRVAQASTGQLFSNRRGIHLGWSPIESEVAMRPWKHSLGHHCRRWLIMLTSSTLMFR